jgi:uncharacterized membrane protein YeaQ/YmgE (transglycosylase-associated protein family)
MGLLAWLVVGFVAGGLAQWVTGSESRGCLATIAVGIIGALIGGAVFNAAGQKGIADFGLWSIFVAFVGSSLLLLVLGAITGSRR